MIPFFITILFFLILGSAFFSASETALFSLNPIDVQKFKKSSDLNKNLVTSLLKSPKDLLITLIIVNVVLNILVQNVVSNIFGTLSGWILTVGIPLALTLIFGEFIPKSIGISNNLRIAPRIALPLRIIQNGLIPIRLSCIRLTTAISRFLFFFLKNENEISADEMYHALRSSKKKGVLGEDEAELMRGYLQLQESNAKGFLRPREEVLFFEISESIDKLIHLFVDQECTRIPVCEENTDNIIGIINSGQLFLQKKFLRTTEDLRPILKKPFFVPESISAQVLLDQMYEKQESIAIVVDEYGTFSGIISLEDLVEAVVGEIFDRRDEKSHYTKSGNDVIIASGKFEILELEALFDVDIESKHNMVTVSGFLIEQLGEIPKSGTKYTYKNLFFHVLSSDLKRVRRIYIRRNIK